MKTREAIFENDIEETKQYETGAVFQLPFTYAIY